MNLACQNPFSGAALPLYQNGNIDTGETVHLLAEPLHRRGLAENHVVWNGVAGSRT
jgi:hypothetical protein